MSPGSNRRTFLKNTALAGASAALLRCAPAAPETPGADTGEGWEATWNQWIAGAKREGVVSLMTQSGGDYPKAFEAFRKAFPGVEIEHKGYNSGTEYGPKVAQEREAGIYAWDVAILSVQSPLLLLRPIGALDPLRPALIHPEVLSDSSWQDGFESGFADTAKELPFLFAEEVRGQWTISTDLVKEDEITKFADVMDPRWRGKIIMGDVRSGSTYPGMLVLRRTLGDDAVRRFLIDQRPTFTRETRQIAEDVVRGKFPIAYNATVANLNRFRQEGLTRHLKALRFPETTYLGAAAALFIFNKAPHPNAAKLFANWVLTKDGQTALTQANFWNSKRLDVPPAEPDTMAGPGEKYTRMGSEENIEPQEQTRMWLESFVK